MVIEHKGKRYSVVGESETEYIVTQPYEEVEGDTIRIIKSEALIIK